ncbi:MAG: D-ribose pyranase [Melioribacteraceae bacterium]|nr:D-ribose pyranase [Melioribacteraceae bacterium]
MKKYGILNRNLSKIIASKGHADLLVICDSGLPIPKNAELVDLALTKNIPSFIDTLKVVLEEFQVEKAVIATELYQNKKMVDEISSMLNGTLIENVDHENFKEITRNGANVSFVRTGEATPYANIILFSGVTF